MTLLVVELLVPTTGDETKQKTRTPALMLLCGTQDVVTGPLALDMHDTACFLTDEQQERMVKGVILKSMVESVRVPRMFVRSGIMNHRLDSRTPCPQGYFSATTRKGDGTFYTSLPGPVEVNDIPDKGVYIWPDTVVANPWASCLLYTSPSPRDRTRSRMPSSA